ncbi:MAG: DUF4176 domain-containing protein [Bacilli bacterium]|nr:DUF4176 domain-containing protein [Bacilli bacterium]
MNESKKYLPIGSVVKLINGNVKLMIAGYVSIDVQKKDKVYDYCGFVYPEGRVSSSQTLLFDHENIAQVISVGYVDDEQKAFVTDLESNLTDENIKAMLENVNGNPSAASF